MKLALATLVSLLVGSVTSIQLSFVSRVKLADAEFDESEAEISAFDKTTSKLFVSNANKNQVDVWDISDPYNPVQGTPIAIGSFGGINSVAVSDGILAVAVENANKQLDGSIVFFDTTTQVLEQQVPAGALPDMVTFTPDGKYAISANEGEPNDLYTIDPKGSVTIVPMFGANKYIPTTIDFTAYDGLEGALRSSGVRIYGPGASASQDLEPEYVAVSKDSKTAYVVLQENNAIATIDIETATVIGISPLGFKDHSLASNAFDASNKDDMINIQTWPTLGMYQPDAISTFEVNGVTYIATANEGDSRDYDGFSEEERVKDLVLDIGAFPNAADLELSPNLGRLKVTTTMGDIDQDGDFDELYSYGGRSFSIFRADTMQLVYDSGSDFEDIISQTNPDLFNANNDPDIEDGKTQVDEFDSRSDDKGPEPEGITTAVIGGCTFVFVCLERVGGIMVYDVTDPFAPSFVEYFRPSLNDDLGPEAVLFIDATDSPLNVPLLVVTNEVSGTTTILRIDSSDTKVFGDPHFKTWKNEHFEYHGQCDLVMIANKKFANDLGLHIHIRTKIVRYWSYIERAVIKIGNDILEIQGSFDKTTANYWINYEHQGELETIGGFPVTLNKNADRYTIDLSSLYPGEKIEIKTYKEFVMVNIVGASEASFGNSVGITGDFRTGNTYARDGSTIIHDFSELGQAWQVLPSDGRFFREASTPQFPEFCMLPEDPRGDRTRRLEEGTVTEEEAEAACARLDDEFDRKACVYDILATQDLDMVGAY